jgi:hypothetical protein
VLNSYLWCLRIYKKNHKGQIQENPERYYVIIYSNTKGISHEIEVNCFKLIYLDPRAQVKDNLVQSSGSQIPILFLFYPAALGWESYGPLANLIYMPVSTFLFCLTLIVYYLYRKCTSYISVQTSIPTN